jgi:hypothetical protein
MSWQAIGTVTSLFTTVVLAAAAIAALIQIRHMRASNQLTAFLEINRVLNSDEFQAAVAFVVKELPQRLHDEKFVSELTGTNPLDRRTHPEVWLADFWDQLGALVHIGVLEAPLFLASNIYMCPLHWQKLLPVVKLVREEEPLTWIEFEDLARLCESYAKKLALGAPWTIRIEHPSGKLRDSLPSS